MTPPGDSDTPGRLQEPQAVLAPLTAAALFLVATVDTGGEAAVRDLLADLFRAGADRRVPGAGRRAGPGHRFGSDAWDRLSPVPGRPSSTPSREVAGERHRAAATPGDLLFHIPRRPDGRLFRAGLPDHGPAWPAGVTVVDEVHGFKYFDDRDLLGFVDGTENPVGRAAAEAVTVGGEDPDFAGSRAT